MVFNAYENIVIGVVELNFERAQFWVCYCYHVIRYDSTYFICLELGFSRTQGIIHI